jgi:restriction endonuclease S subunit
MENKISKFTTSIAEKGKRIASLEAELKRAREEYEA